MASRRRFTGRRRLGRSRAKYTWLPTIGTATVEGGSPVAGRDFALTVPADGTAAVTITPLTYDIPKELEDVTEENLQQVVGHDWFLRRIVGNFHAGLDQVTDNATEFVAEALVTAGFLVARADSTGLQPIGTAQTEYDPNDINHIREPWIWRRSWFFGNRLQARGYPWVAGVGAADTTTTQDPLNQRALANFPTGTFGYAHGSDGHIDQKTMRRITNDDRLWFAVGVQGFPLGAVFDSGVQVRGYLDYRLLGQLRRPRNRGNF